MNERDAPVRPGDILAGKYRVERILGVGAMGVVVAAMHVDLHEMRAIKFMLPSMLGDAEGVERFLREARAAVRLKSQHVAKIHDIGRLETGAPYIVMEYLQGSDVKQLLEARGQLAVHEAATYLIQVCEAIAEAHALGIVHRDLKPANLFITTGSNGAPCVKVLDFGIAKIAGGSGQAMDMTGTSDLLGTPLYMSPEQMRSTRNVDGRTDIWALGCILYKMLAGRTPFAGSNVTEICSAVIADQPDPPSGLRADVSPALEAVVLRCLEKSAAKRFATATELATALAPFAVASARASAPAAPRERKTEVMQVVAMPAGASMEATPLVASPNGAAVTATPPAMLAAASTGVQPGNSTARASTWSQPATGAPAATGRKGAGLVGVLVIGTVLVLGAFAFAASRFLRSDERAPVVAAASTATTATPAGSTTSASVSPATARAPQPAAPPVVVAVVEPAPSAAAPAAAAPAAAAPKPAARPAPTGRLPRPAGKPSDAAAFGNDRK